MRAPSPSEKVADRFAGVRQKFRETIDDRIVLFEISRRDLGAGTQGVQAMERMAAEAHRISGVAETLGFTRMGATAALLETEIHAALRAGHTVHRLRERVEPLIEELLDRLEEALEP